MRPSCFKYSRDRKQTKKTNLLLTNRNCFHETGKWFQPCLNKRNNLNVKKNKYKIFRKIVKKNKKFYKFFLLCIILQTKERKNPFRSKLRRCRSVHSDFLYQIILFLLLFIDQFIVFIPSLLPIFTFTNIR